MDGARVHVCLSACVRVCACKVCIFKFAESLTCRKQTSTSTCLLYMTSCLPPSRAGGGPRPPPPPPTPRHPPPPPPPPKKQHTHTHTHKQTIYIHTQTTHTRARAHTQTTHTHARTHTHGRAYTHTHTHTHTLTYTHTGGTLRTRETSVRWHCRSREVLQEQLNFFPELKQNHEDAIRAAITTMEVRLRQHCSEIIARHSQGQP